MIIDADGVKHAAPGHGSKVLLGRSGKERIYKTVNGLCFWFDADSSCFLTDDPGIYLYHYSFSFARDERSAFFLHLHGQTIAFSESAAGFGFFRHDWAKKRDDGSRFWEIGGIGGLFRNPGRAERTKIALSNITKFRSQEEQDFAITFVTDVLSRYVGYAKKHWEGGTEEAEVIFTEEVQRQLANGELIEGTVS